MTMQTMRPETATMTMMRVLLSATAAIPLSRKGVLKERV